MTETLTMNLIRRYIENEATVGELFIDGVFQCFTLEDAVRTDPKPSTPANEAKVWGKTAIPAGSYTVILNVSPRFGRVLPRLLEVPGFDGILIHRGNAPTNTDGCILVGKKVSGGRIVGGTSTPAFNALFSRLVAAKAAGKALRIVVSEDWDTTRAEQTPS